MYRKVIFGLIGVALLSILLAACTIRDQAELSSGPAVHMGGSDFIQKTITLKKGDRLTLVDDVASPHVIANGTWDNSTPKPGTEPGAPKVSLNFTGSTGESKPTDPFTTAGTFKLYCTIHGGMNLTITVQ